MDVLRLATLPSRRAEVNWLTHHVGDPLIGTPEFKISAVRVERAA